MNNKNKSLTTEKLGGCTLSVFWIFAISHLIILIYFFVTSLFIPVFFIPISISSIFHLIVAILLSINKYKNSYTFYLTSLIISIIHCALIAIALIILFLPISSIYHGDALILIIKFIIIIIEIVPTIILCIYFSYYDRLKFQNEINENLISSEGLIDDHNNL